MSNYQPGEWLQDSDAPQDDIDDFLALSKPEDDDPDTGEVAGCIFGAAVITACIIAVWILTLSGWVW